MTSEHQIDTVWIVINKSSSFSFEQSFNPTYVSWGVDPRRYLHFILQIKSFVDKISDFYYEKQTKTYENMPNGDGF